MNDTDKKIQEILNSKVDIPDHFDKAIREALYTKEGQRAVLSYRTYLQSKKNRFKKVAAAVIASISTFSTICVAGYAYDRVWYEPETYSYEDIKQALNAGVSEEMKEGLISEDEAKEIAIEAATGLGYENVEISSLELDNDVSDNEVVYYTIVVTSNLSDNIYVKINGKNGEIVNFKDENFTKQYHKDSIDNISKDEALIYANNIMHMIHFNEEDYKLSEVKNETTYISTTLYNVWNVTYFKVYNGICNPYEKITTIFVVSKGKPIISEIYKIESGKFENDLINISQEDAINIAINKELEFTSNKIIEIDVELGIRKMNDFIYKLENNISNSNNMLQSLYVPNISRKVWFVTIKHPLSQITNIDDISILKHSDKTYFIDCASGDIIGGRNVIID